MGVLQETITNQATKTGMNLGYTRKQIIGAIVGLVIGAIIFSCPPPVGLTPKAMMAMGIFACAIAYWVFEVFHDYITALLMCLFWVVTGCVKFEVAFSVYSTTTFWILVGAIGLGVGVANSGLLTRIAYLIMKVFPASFKGQTLAMMTAGTVIAPLIPSTTAKVILASPISVGISKALGFKPKSNGAAGLYMATYLGFVCTAPIFMSACFFGYILQGVLAPEVRAQFPWGTWFMAMIPWAIVFLVCGYFTILKLYKPEENVTLSSSYVKEQLEKLGPMKWQEKVTLAVLLISLVLWILERTLGIPAAITACAAMSVLTAFKIMSKKDFRDKIIWEVLVFVGCVVSIGTVLPALGIDKWIASVFGPALANYIWVYAIISDSLVR